MIKDINDFKRKGDELKTFFSKPKNWASLFSYSKNKDRGRSLINEGLPWIAEHIPLLSGLDSAVGRGVIGGVGGFVAAWLAVPLGLATLGCLFSMSPLMLVTPLAAVGTMLAAGVGVGAMKAVFGIRDKKDPDTGIQNAGPSQDDTGIQNAKGKSLDMSLTSKKEFNSSAPRPDAPAADNDFTFKPPVNNNTNNGAGMNGPAS